MSDQEAIVRRFVEQAFNGGHLDAIDAMLSDDFEEHQALGPGAPQGRAAVKAIVASLHRAFADFHMTVEDVAERGDVLWARLRATGRHVGPFLGREPTGRSIDITVIDVFRLRDDRIVEHWGVADGLAALRQIELGQAGRGA